MIIKVKHWSFVKLYEYGDVHVMRFKQDGFDSGISQNIAVWSFFDFYDFMSLFLKLCKGNGSQS